MSALNDAFDPVVAATNGWFNQYGMLRREIPEDVVRSCSGPGDQEENVRAAVALLRFAVPRDLAVDYLVETGAWDRAALATESDEWLAMRVLWLACSTLRENEPWLGVVW